MDKRKGIDSLRYELLDCRFVIAEVLWALGKELPSAEGMSRYESPGAQPGSLGLLAREVSDTIDELRRELAGTRLSRDAWRAEAQRLANGHSTTPTTRTVELLYTLPMPVGTQITVGPTDPADDPSEVGVVLSMDGTKVTLSTDPAVIEAMAELSERARALEAQVAELRRRTEEVED